MDLHEPNDSNWILIITYIIYFLARQFDASFDVNITISRYPDLFVSLELLSPTSICAINLLILRMENNSGNLILYLKFILVHVLILAAITDFVNAGGK